MTRYCPTCRNALKSRLHKKKSRFYCEECGLFWVLEWIMVKEDLE